MTVRKLGIAKFGSKAEKDTTLKIFADRRPKTTTVRITKEKNSKYAFDFEWKTEGDNNISRHIQLDDESAVSLIKWNIKRALRLLMPVKPLPPQPPTKSPRPPKYGNNNPKIRRRSRRVRNELETDESTVFCPTLLAVQRRNKTPENLNNWFQYSV